ncbi:MAG: MoaD/ThiS family protein [Pirellulaceae bacterium]|jgi:molybdopterin converting factor small subunit|nr:MoaD/ThiS family protein [Pirellulaceae bacterium]MDG2470255.1 MoaD/ThiS family protein [Pirellulaceae bacterium]
MKVLLFAALKESLGPSIELNIVGKTVCQIKDDLAAQEPTLASLIARSHFAVDQEYVGDHFEFSTEPRELAIVPPVSGG